VAWQLRFDEVIEEKCSLWGYKFASFTALALDDSAATVGFRTTAETVSPTLPVRLANFDFAALHDIIGLGTRRGRLAQVLELNQTDGVGTASNREGAGQRH
jgi:hypothetical protein